MNWLKFMSVSLIASCTLIACGDGGNDKDNQQNNQKDCVGKCDDNEGKPACSGLVVDHRSKELSDGEIKGLNDPLARYVLRRGEECPTSFDAVMDKLRVEDSDGCDPEKRTAGIETAAVSETAQLLDEPTDYRLVVTRKCKDDGELRKQEDLMFSIFGVPAGAERLPQQGVEVMGFDKTAGVYNYYVIEGNEISFQGNSLDYINGTEAAGRCAGCHLGGGPVMKELDTPWLHWEGHHTTPGAKDLIKAHENLGSVFSGSRMESITKSGVRKTNEMRLASLATEGTARDVLRPLFCPIEVNLDNGRDFADRGTFKVGKDFLLDPQFASFGGVNVDLMVYTEAIAEAGQFMSLNGRAPLEDAEGNVVRDTIFAFSYLERGFADDDYVKKLKSNELVDDDFIFDVLAVDFTRPLLSPERCGLLDHVPAELAGSEVAPQAIKDAMIKSLEGVENRSPEEEALLTNLQTADDTAAHKEQASAFVSVCDDRDEAEFIADVIKYSTLVRRHFLDHDVMSVFEFAPTMAFSTQDVSSSAKLDPETCVLSEGDSE